MRDLFLYEEMKVLYDSGIVNKEIPDSIAQNLNPEFEIRDYQEEAFTRFIYHFNKKHLGRSKRLHLLFNMATGSGKTLIMAGLILYLYEQGYSNFLFFVNSNNIIKKTQDNFLDPKSSKFLFNSAIYVKGKKVTLTQVENFDGVNKNDINLCFTSIQQLHTDITTDKENALTLENFADKKIALFADEAHHMNVQTKAQLELQLTGQKPSWENTVERIFNSNEDTLLLEFTATHNYENSNLIEKYQDKVIYRYDFKDFRNNRFSKDVILVHSNLGLEDRIIQALILNQYKQRVATKYGIPLKPVILFKAQKKIDQSRQNKAIFHKLIDELTGSQIDRLRDSEVEILLRAFRFFDENGISSEQLVQHLKSDFQSKYCLLVNSKEVSELIHIVVNSLEDKDNTIRAIFAVKQLDEGWDVLNLFDIVRCYETRDTRFNKPGSTTMSEAQLIGRGARYFPFTMTQSDDGPDLPEINDRFRRKFDDDTDHELRVLEELHYYSVNDSKYISEIRSALVDEGIIDKSFVIRELRLKDSFKETNLYKHGVVWLNERKPRSYHHVSSFKDIADLSVKQKNLEHTVRTGAGGATTIMEERETGATLDTASRDIRIVDIEQNIVQSAIARNPFFKFSALKRYFPKLISMDDFRTSESYLGGLAITFNGDVSQLEDNPIEKLRACSALLEKIESELRRQITDYEGTKNFYEKRINAVFTDKNLKFSADNVRADDTHESEHLVKVKDWFAFNGLYGTSEEKAFVKMINRWIADSEEAYEDIYLLRNEKHLSLYNFSDGRVFEPDFVLFLGKTNGKSLTYQLFIEPKGEHLEDGERWKEDFLKQIYVEYHTRILAEDSKYRVIGVPAFYNSQRENEFRTKLNETLQDTDQMREQEH